MKFIEKLYFITLLNKKICLLINTNEINSVFTTIIILNGRV